MRRPERRRLSGQRPRDSDDSQQEASIQQDHVLPAEPSRARVHQAREVDSKRRRLGSAFRQEERGLDETCPVREVMITLILTGLLRVLRTRRALVLENLALRHQLAVLQRAAPRPHLRPSDRLFWVLLARLWHGWAEAVAIVQSETVIRWQRRRLHALLDLEEPPERARLRERLPGGPSSYPTNVACQPPLGRAPDSR
jgi:hypothetical protein